MNLPDESAGHEAGGLRRALVAVAVGALVGGSLLLFLATRGRKPPLLPSDLVHRAAFGGQVPRDCLVCHARSAAVPPPPTHTGRTDCLDCHLLP